MTSYDANFKFDFKFFCDKIFMLERLKKYLNENPNENFTHTVDYEKLLRDGLQWHVPKEMSTRVSLSIKDAFAPLGGVRAYQKRAFYEISPSAVAVVYAVLSDERECRNTNLSEMSTERGRALLVKLYGKEVRTNSSRLRIFMIWVRRDVEEVEAAIRLKNDEMRGLDPEIVYDKICNVLRTYLDKAAERPELYREPLD